MVPKLKTKYQENLVPALKKHFNFESAMRVPKLVKIGINKGIGVAVSDKKLIDIGIEEISAVTGQRAVATYAKKSVSNFKLREGMPIGAKVTLRNTKMYEFLDRLINIALPRVRDFNGISDKSFDGRGNYTLGIREQIIFPEISIDKVKNISGINITIVTSTDSDEESYELLKAFGFPFKTKS